MLELRGHNQRYRASRTTRSDFPVHGLPGFVASQLLSNAGKKLFQFCLTALPPQGGAGLGDNPVDLIRIEVGMEPINMNLTSAVVQAPAGQDAESENGESARPEDPDQYRYVHQKSQPDNRFQKSSP